MGILKTLGKTTIGKRIGAKSLGSPLAKGSLNLQNGFKKALVHQKLPQAKPNAFAKFNARIPAAPHAPTSFIPRPTLKYK